MSDEPGLHPQEAVGDSLRAVARHILREARTAIEDRDRIEAVKVHDFRAAMKRWRAFLRLVEPLLDPDDRIWRSEARDLARALTGARNVQSTLDAIADVERHAASHRLSSRSWATMRNRVEDMRETAENASLSPAMRTRIASALDRADARIEQWPLDAVTFEEVAHGLAYAYRRARHACPKDWRAANPEELHRLRQHVVVHRYQMEMLLPLWPRLGKSWVREAQRLRTRLGKCQDLAMLAHLAAPHQPLARWRSPLNSVIMQRHARHVDVAARHAARLFAEQPKAFRKRLKSMWSGAKVR
jgi:CHAD domain-containing protein